MKKISSALLLVLLALVLISSQALAQKPTHTPKPKHTPDASEAAETEDEAGGKPEKAGKPAGKKYNFQGEISSFDGSLLVINLKKGGTANISVNADTVIKIPGNQENTGSLQTGDRVIAQTVLGQNGGYLAIRIHLIPGKPMRIHRVGVVTAYDGATITIQAKDGATYTFQVAAEAKILPEGQATALQPGVTVTIISPRTFTGDLPIAKGIVIHPEGETPDD